MAQLTYWGLQNFDHVPSARTARKALVSQMDQMMMEQWNNHGYICENYFPAKGHDGCSPGAMHFYHWGALSGFISLVEEGYY
jgi:putative isomerase|eukprot:COSAG06_NODE_1582_length_9017_cov_11.406593_2_plen_82_part_00